MKTMHRKHVMITDLDQSDGEGGVVPVEVARRAQRKRHNGAKILNTMSGNFNRRSRSAECGVAVKTEHRSRTGAGYEPRGGDGGAGGGGGGDGLNVSGKSSRVHGYLNELLQAKDKQMEQLLQRLSTVHKFNEQFAEENQNLRSDVESLQQRLTRLQQQVDDCSRCQKLSTQLTTTISQNRTLVADVEMMKTLVYRLNVQIELYQEQLRTLKEQKADSADLPSPITPITAAPKSSTLPQWQAEVPTHTLTPLLRAYDEMIADKQELVQQYRQEFENFTGELKRVLEENNRLVQLHETLKRDMGNWREERTCLQAQLTVCRTKAEAQTRKSDLAKEKLVEVMHCYEQKTQTLLLDMEHLQTAYARCKSELAQYKSLAAQPPETIAQSLQECKELLEQLRQQHNSEKQSLEHHITDLSTQKTQLEEKHEQQRQELNTLQQELGRKLEVIEELQTRMTAVQRLAEKAKRSRDRLKARLRIALQWAQKLERGQADMQSTWDALKRLETIVKHKEAQVRGLHVRNLEEIDKMQRKLDQREETIRTILKGKLERHQTVD